MEQFKGILGDCRRRLIVEGDCRSLLYMPKKLKKAGQGERKGFRRRNGPICKKIHSSKYELFLVDLLNLNLLLVLDLSRLHSRHRNLSHPSLFFLSFSIKLSFVLPCYCRFPCWLCCLQVLCLLSFLFDVFFFLSFFFKTISISI